MACKYFDNCEHHSGWCQSDNMIYTCTYGLNRIISEHTLDKIELEKKIKKLKSEKEFVLTILKTISEQIGDYGITDINTKEALTDLQKCFKEFDIKISQTGVSL